MLAIAICIAAAFWRRWFGGWPACRLNRAVKLSVCFAISLAAVSSGLDLSFWLGIIVAALITASFAPGHGSYMDPALGRGDDNEFLAPILKGFLPYSWHLSPAYRCIGMALRYSIFTIPVGFLIGSPAYAAAGLLISALYTVGSYTQHRVPRTTGPALDGYTAYCEFAMGAILVGGVYL